MRPALPAPKPDPRQKRAARPVLARRTESIEGGERPLGKGVWIAILIAIVVAMLVEQGPVRELVGKSVQSLREPVDLSANGFERGLSPREPERSAEPASAAVAPHSKAAALDLADRMLESAASLAMGPLQEVVDLSSEGMDAELGPDGRVLLTSKYRVLSLGAGNANDRRTRFSSEMYRAQFPQGRVQAMASALALPGERWLLGGWHGEVLLGSREGLQRLSARDERPRGRIADMQHGDEAVLIAGDGLWRLKADGNALEELPLPTRQRLVALGVQGEQVLLAEDGRRVYRWTGASAEPWLELPRADARLQVLAAAADASGWWIGSTRGLLRVDPQGRVLESLLDDVWISAVVERPGELWVGSWKQGLLLRRADRWYRLGEGLGGLAASSVSGITVDPADHVWLALYGGGAWHAPLSSLRDALLHQPWNPVADARD